jgi:SAM-dependent methyltransferase
LSIGQNLTVDEFVALYDAGTLSLALAGEFSLEPPALASQGLDPRSRQYAEAVMQTWSALTGRDSYDPVVDESFDLDLDEFVARPYPYSSRDPQDVGRYLAAVGWFMLTLAPKPGSRIVELGAGWGHLASSLAMTGYDVTAVDLNSSSVEVLRERNSRLGIQLKVEQSTFLDYRDGDFDMVIFFEAFHHCAEPLELLDRCVSMLRPGGQLVFLAEAIYDDFYCPWGVRPDGPAIFMARYAGWLELGFNRSFMYRELNARGFSITRHRLDTIGPYGTLDIGLLEPNGDTFRGELAPDEALTWDSRTPAGFEGRLATEAACVTLCESEAFTQAHVSLSNRCDTSIHVEIDAGAKQCAVDLTPGERTSVAIQLAAGRRVLRVRSDQAPAATLGLDRTGVCVESVTLSG